MKYTVHHYLPVLVRVDNVEADSMEQAVEDSMEEAMEFANEHLTSEARHCGNIKSSQFGDGHLGALVDVDGDEEFLQSCFIGSTEASNYLPNGGDQNG